MSNQSPTPASQKINRVQAPTQSLWPTKTAVVYGESHNLHKIISEFIKSFGWRVAEVEKDYDVAMQFIREGRATILIVEETPEQPFFVTQRLLMADEIGCMTPIFGLLAGKQKNDREILLRIGVPDLIMKPLTPATFIPSFSNVLRKWESKAFTALRACQYRLLRGKHAESRDMLEKLAKIPPIQSVAVGALALQTMRDDHPKNCEKLLLESISQMPGSLGLLIQLGQLYMNYSAPKLALDIFTKAQTAFKNTPVLSLDIIQAHLMLNNLEDATRVMTEYLDQESMRAMLANYLSRTMIAGGMQDRIGQIISDRVDIVQGVKKSWLNAENFHLKDIPVMAS